MPFSIQILPLADRKARIDAELSSPVRVVPFRFRARMRDLPVIRVPIGLPTYRMANGRTQSEQNDYLLTHPGVPRDFFDAGQENQSAQEQQHHILLEMSQAPTGPVYQVLQRVAEQTEPLLITAHGVLVNGNRRLAAMRDLYARDPQTYRLFENVDAMVLPAEATEEDLERTEVELQMQVETKLDYTWIDKRLKIRKLVNPPLGLSVTEVQKLMQYNSVAQVNSELLELDCADEYLRDYVQRPGDYKQIGKSEQIFKEIAKRLKSLSGPDRDVARGIAFTIVKQGGAEDRAYRYRDAFGKHLPKVRDRLITDLNLAIPNPDTGAGPENDDDDDPLGGLAPSDTPGVPQLIATLNDSSHSPDLARRITTIHDSIIQQTNDENQRVRALDDARAALDRLLGIDLLALASDHYEGIQDVFEQLSLRISRLKAQLSELQAGSSHNPEQ